MFADTVAGYKSFEPVYGLSRYRAVWQTLSGLQILRHYINPSQDSFYNPA